MRDVLQYHHVALMLQYIYITSASRTLSPCETDPPSFSFYAICSLCVYIHPENHTSKQTHMHTKFVDVLMREREKGFLLLFFFYIDYIWNLIRNSQSQTLPRGFWEIQVKCNLISWLSCVHIVSWEPSWPNNYFAYKHTTSIYFH